MSDAIEVDVDAICDGTEVLVGGIMEHIEEAGVHSGDSACSLPPYSLPSHIQDRLRDQTRTLALALNVIGLMNIQFAVKNDDIYVLEVNPRASRTVPFVSKATSRPLAKIAARCMTGKTLAEQNVTNEIIPEYYSVKEAVFPFIKFPGADTVLGPEMKSTGEVMGIGRTFGEAYGKSQLAAGTVIPDQGRVLISVKTVDQESCVAIARYFSEQGFRIVATHGTAAVLNQSGIEVRSVNKVQEGRPHVVDMIKNKEIDMIVNTTAGKQSLKDSYTIRRAALQNKVTYFTTLAAARAACEAHRAGNQLGINLLQKLHEEVNL